MKVKPGQIIKIKVNGKTVDTIIGSDRKQYFIQNKLYRHLVDQGRIDLTDLANDFGNGKFCLKEYMQFYMGLGQTVTGFEEIFGSGGNLEKKDWVKIQNPLDRKH